MKQVFSEINIQISSKIRAELFTKIDLITIYDVRLQIWKVINYKTYNKLSREVRRNIRR